MVRGQSDHSTYLELSAIPTEFDFHSHFTTSLRARCGQLSARVPLLRGRGYLLSP